MKKLSEVCKIVGVTRRTLQEYKRIGLLEPTDITDAGHWLYDDNAIQTLMLIQVFVAAGYRRKQIKAILELPDMDKLREFNRLPDVLKEKRDKIDGFIAYIKTITLPQRLPEDTIRALSNMDITRIYSDKSFISNLDDFVRNYVESTEVDRADTELFTPFIISIISIFAIGGLTEQPEDSAPVQAAVEQSYHEWFKFAQHCDDAFQDEDSSDPDNIEFYLEFLQDMLSIQEFQKLDLQLGEGAAAYIIRAVQVFCKRKSCNDQAK